MADLRLVAGRDVAPSPEILFSETQAALDVLRQWHRLATADPDLREPSIAQAAAVGSRAARVLAAALLILSVEREDRRSTAR